MCSHVVLEHLPGPRKISLENIYSFSFHLSIEELGLEKAVFAEVSDSFSLALRALSSN